MATYEELWRQVHNLTEQFAPLAALREALREPLDLDAAIARLRPQVEELETMIAEREAMLRELNQTVESATAYLDTVRKVVADVEVVAAPIQAEQRRVEAKTKRLAEEVAQLEKHRDRLTQAHATTVSLQQAEIRSLDAETARRQAALKQINEAIAATKSAAARL